MTVKEFIGKKVIYDKETYYLWAKEHGEYDKMIARIRGWAYIHSLFKTDEEAANFQDEIGEFIAQAINEKIERDGK